MTAESSIYQPIIRDADHNHPRFDDYMRVRAAFIRQLLRAPSFAEWLRGEA